MPSLGVPEPEPTDGVIALRAFRDDDVPEMVRACSDPDIARFVSAIPQPYGEDDARAWLATHPHSLLAGTELHLCIADARSDELLGATGVHHVDWHNRRLETGYWIAPWARRRGIGTRGLRVLADWVLGPFGFGRIELVADVENVASQRLADAAGFEREGRLRAYLQDRDGVRRDVFMFSRTRSASGGAGSP